MSRKNRQRKVSPRKNSSSKKQKFPLALILTASAAVIVALLLILPGLSSSGVNLPEPLTYSNPVGKSLGDPNAPVLVEEFSDFQCSFCRRFHDDTLPQILEAYVDTGKVNFVYRHFPILGPGSTRAAIASACAQEAGLFWEYHDILFANQNESNPEAFSFGRLEDFAEALGMSGSDFRSCLLSTEFNAAIEAEYEAAQAAGASSTPSFLINGVLLSGAQPFEVFQEAIESALAQ
jgi:protein-disulfide isomerase